MDDLGEEVGWNVGTTAGDGISFVGSDLGGVGLGKIGQRGQRDGIQKIGHDVRWTGKVSESLQHEAGKMTVASMTSNMEWTLISYYFQTMFHLFRACWHMKGGL